ncbi:399_t:CDS:2, partial [Funneliformis geosporum]
IMAFLALIPIAAVIKEIVETVAVVGTVAGAVTATAYVGAKVVDGVTRRMESIYYWWGNGLSYEEYEKLLGQGYERNECFTLEEAKHIIFCEKKVGKPTKEVGYKPKKNWDGKKKKVPNDRSKEKGYPDEEDNVWIPKENQHGGPGWTVQHKDGRGHHHVDKNGKVRRH